MRRRPRRIVAVLAVAALALGVLVLWRLNTAPPAPAAGLGGPFALVTQDGRPFTDRDLRGKPAALFFGFTNCPQVCPTTLAQWTATLKTMGPDADRLRAVFVTVDPERDTPAVMKRYLSDFDGRIVGLSGPPDKVRAMLAAYHVYFKRVPLGGGAYTMDHTAATYLFNKDGEFEGLIGYPVAPADELAKLSALAKGRTL